MPTAATALRDAVVHRPPGEAVLLTGMLRAVSSALVLTALGEAAQRLPAPERDRLAQQLAAAELHDFARAVDGHG